MALFTSEPARKKTFYLDAPGKTQELLVVQRALESAGCSIGSTWHEQQAPPQDPGSEWIRERQEELVKCDGLIVLCGEKQKTQLQIPLLAGYALSRGIRVIWIGSSTQITSYDANSVQFSTIKEFCSGLAMPRAA